ncbi:MAG: NAD-dependent ligase adenylation domain, partial [Firmicutes bacterium]|nr:NAD-dependent ligase adenylation domain [Bacillota bacterium]
MPLVTRQEAEQRIIDLSAELHRHEHAYYVLNQPEITDAEFDKLIQELKRL